MISIHLIGPPDNGVSMLLMAIYGTLDHQRFECEEVSPRLREQLANFVRGERDVSTSEAEAPEFLSLVDKRDGRRYHLRSYGGEEVLGTKEGVRPRDFLNQFDDGVLAIVLNPFACCEKLADKALRALVRYLNDEEGIGPLVGIEVACQALFHLGAEPLKKRYPDVLSILAGEQNVHIGDDGLWSGFNSSRNRERFKNAVSKLLTDLVREVKPYLDQMRPAAGALPNCVVVLSHADLLPLIPAVSEEDFQGVFRNLLGDTGVPAQRIVAMTLQLIVRRQDDEGPRGIWPWDFRNDSIRETLDKLLNYVNRIAAGNDGPSHHEPAFLRHWFLQSLPFSLTTGVCAGLIGAALEPHLRVAEASAAAGFTLFGLWLALSMARKGLGLERSVRSLALGREKLRVNETTAVPYRQVIASKRWLLGDLLGVGAIRVSGETWWIAEPGKVWDRLAAKGVRIRNYSVLDFVWILALGALLYSFILGM